MAQRLIYNPKSWVFTKDANGVIYDLSDYITSGRVERLIDQVSTAEVTLRNPDKVFTNPATGVAFHPMDPITIWLERVNGHPVQVFTGFLDQTPYYQLFPGKVTLKASCTLKRLLYTYFDPALPYFESFLFQFGWGRSPTGDGSIANIAENELKKIGNSPDTNLIHFGSNQGEEVTKKGINDTSLGRLLWALLFHVADIKHENIYIESIPPAVATLVSRLFKEFDHGQELASKELEYFLQQIIGTGSQGEGGGGSASTPSGNVKGIKDIVSWVRKVQRNYSSVPLEMILAVMYVETDMSGQDSSGNPQHTGWFQAQNKESGGSPPYAYGPWSHTVPSVAETHDLGTALNAFCAAAQGVGSADPNLKTAPYLDWAMRTQGVTSQNNPRYPETWAGFIAKAKQNLSEFGEQSSEANAAPEETQKGTTAPGKGSGGYVNPFENATTGETDEGVDFTGTGNIGAVGPARVTYSSDQSGWYTTSHGREAFLIYEITAGTHKGQFVYIAEDIDNLASVGTVVKGGPKEPLCKFAPGSIEMGWAEPPGTSPAVAAFSHGGGREGSAPAGGKDFAKFLKGEASVGGGTTGTGGGTTSGETGGTTGATDPEVAAKAAAFTSEIAFPTVMEKAEAILLSGQKALMNDVPLLPFIQQVAKASMRSFMSLPNGDFYAFYPDYFGEMGHHPAYWYIEDIEVLDGGIELNDKNLATHVYAVGDTTWPANNKLQNELSSAGTVNIFNAFTSETVGKTSNSKIKHNHQTAPPPFGPKEGINLAPAMKVEEAKKFLERYGARPVVMDLPMIRSHTYEMLMAYQGFCIAWSRQFLTPFKFTFMPELFPGGKVGFPDHGIQMYIESVTHEWDLETGYTTEANLSAPSLMNSNSASLNSQLPPNMVHALSESIRGQGPASSDKGHRTQNPPVAKHLPQGHYRTS